MDVPKPVSDKFEELKKRHKHLTLARINNRFYVSESTKRLVESEGRYKTFSLYIGRINKDGSFAEAKHRKKSSSADSLEALIKRSGDEAKNEELDYLEEIDMRILEFVSTDARKPIANLADELGVSESVLSYRLKKLEERYGIRYVAEISTSVFGFSRFAIMIKFTGTVPDYGSIKEELEKSPLVHLVLATKGQYDLFIIAIAENTVNFESFVYKLRTSKVFSGHNSVWQTSYIGVRYGYLPLRDAIFSVLKDRVWHRTKERPSKQHEQLFEREYLLLKELADDASQEFSAIDRKLGFGKGASQYTYHRLLEKDIVKRITITMDKPPIRYVGIIHADQINMRRFMESRKELFIDRIAHTDNALNRYLLSADFGSPYGILMLAPVFGDSGIALMEKSLKSRIKGIRVRSLVVTDVLVGRIGYRRFDNRHSKAYKTLKETYGYTEEELERLLYPGK